MTAADLTVAPTRGGLESLTPAQRDAAVTRYLEDAHERLSMALAATAVDVVRSIKAEASVMAELSRQVNVSKEVQTDAAEMVRRAEWALGKAVRAGQERGEVRPRGDQSEVPEGTSPVSEFIRPGKELHDITTMADADDETFEDALTDARAEGNVSRANVVRKVRERAGEKPRQAPRRALTDQFFDAAYDMARAIERVHKLTGDDRWESNKAQIASKHGSDLRQAADLLEQVLHNITN